MDEDTQSAQAVEALGALRDGAALWDPGDRELVVATGADRVRFLQGIVTADVAKVAAGGGVHASLLTTKAHVVAELHLFVRADELYLVVAGAGQAAPAAAALGRYAIMDDVALAPRPELGVLAVAGPAAAARLAEVGVTAAAALAERPLLAHTDAPDAPQGPLWLARTRQLGADGFWIAGAPEALARLGAELGARGVPRLPPALVEAARIAAGEPAFGKEITADYFPMEVGLGGTIEYGKGCFLGQEPIVRIRDRGQINWRLARLELAAGGGALPAPGDRLETDAKPKAGRITSAARLPDGRAVALALVHLSVPAGARVRIRRADAAGAGGAAGAGDGAAPAPLEALVVAEA